MSGLSIGIDLGSFKTVVAIAKGGIIDVFVNDLGNRNIPSIIGFTEKQRIMGDSAQANLRSNFPNTIASPSRFLDKSSDLSKELKWLTAPIIRSGEEIYFEVNYFGEKIQVSPEQVTGAFLFYIRQTISSQDNQIDSIIISVPVYFTQRQRQCLMVAAEIAGIADVQLLNSPTAICFDYGYHCINDLDDVYRTVAFVDIGHSQFSCTITKGNDQEFKVLAHTTDQHLGGRDIDYILMKFFSQKIGSNLFKGNSKLKLRLLSAVRGLKENLSVNREDFIELLVQDIDFSERLSREEFEIMIEGLLLKVVRLCELAKSIAKVGNVHSVQIFGGTTRIPAVQKVISSVFKVESVSRSLNIDESVARGCGLYSACMNPRFVVKDFSVADSVYYPIFYSISPSYEQILLFHVNNQFPETKIVSVKAKSSFLLNFEYCKQDEKEVKKKLKSYKVSIADSNTECSIRLSIKMNSSGFINIINVENKEMPENIMLEEMEENLHIDYFRQEEQKMQQMDLLTINALGKKYELESFIYEWKDLINGKYSNYVKDEEKQELFNQLEATLEWVNIEGLNANITELQRSSENLQNLTRVIERRFRVSERFNKMYKKFFQFYYSADLNWLSSMKSGASETDKSIVEKLEQLAEYFSRMNETFQSIDPSDLLQFGLEEIEQKYQEAKNSYFKR